MLLGEIRKDPKKTRKFRWLASCGGLHALTQERAVAGYHWSRQRIAILADRTKLHPVELNQPMNGSCDVGE
jgi:hypothetical protein